MTPFQRQHGILVAAVGAYRVSPPTAAWMIESGRRQSIEVTVLGRGRPYPSHRTKTRLVAEHLRDHPEYRYVLQVDYRDILFCATLREAFHKYRAFGHRIVASAERACWPMPMQAPLCPDTETSARYLNSGAIFATAEAWLAAWDLMCQKERRHGGRPPELGLGGRHIFDDDQAAWTDLYVHRESDIVLDARSEIFQSLARVDHRICTANRELVFEGRRIVNRETGARPCVIHCNGRVPVEPWAHYILDPPVPWAWALVERVRAEPLATLRDPGHIERLLLDLGLHDPVGDEPPDDLLPYSGKGLAVGRRPREFAAMLTWLAGRPPVRSYAEIRVGNGGAFIATVAYLRRFQPPDLALGVGPGVPPVLLDFVSRERAAHFVRGSRAADGLQCIAASGGHVDLTLINADGDTDSAARADWEFARTCSRYVAFHGIAAGSSSVAPLWQEIRATHRVTHEFLDPRPPSGSPCGLGLVDLAYGTDDRRVP
jgi:hypothetical protein